MGEDPALELRLRDAGRQVGILVEAGLGERVRIEALLHPAGEDLHVVVKADGAVGVRLVAGAPQDALQAVSIETAHRVSLVLAVGGVEAIDPEQELLVCRAADAVKDLPFEIRLRHADGCARGQPVPVGERDPDPLAERVKEKHTVENEGGQDEGDEIHDNLVPWLHHAGTSCHRKGGGRRRLPWPEGYYFLTASFQILSMSAITSSAVFFLNTYPCAPFFAASSKAAVGYIEKAHG